MALSRATLFTIRITLNGASPGLTTPPHGCCRCLLKWQAFRHASSSLFVECYGLTESCSHRESIRVTACVRIQVLTDTLIFANVPVPCQGGFSTLRAYHIAGNLSMEKIHEAATPPATDGRNLPRVSFRVYLSAYSVSHYGYAD